MYVYVKMFSGDTLSFSSHNCRTIRDLRYDTAIRLQQDSHSLAFFKEELVEVEDSHLVKDEETYNVIVNIITYKLTYQDGSFCLYSSDNNSDWELEVTYKEEKDVFYGEEDSPTYYWVRDVNHDIPRGDVFIDAVDLSDEAYEVIRRDVFNLFSTVPMERRELASQFITEYLNIKAVHVYV